MAELFLSAFLLAHPDATEQKLEVDYVLARNIFDVTGIVERRWAQLGWEVVEIKITKVEHPLMSIAARLFPGWSVREHRMELAERKG